LGRKSASKTHHHHEGTNWIALPFVLLPLLIITSYLIKQRNDKWGLDFPLVEHYFRSIYCTRWNGLLWSGNRNGVNELHSEAHISQHRYIFRCPCYINTSGPILLWTHRGYWHCRHKALSPSLPLYICVCVCVCAVIVSINIWLANWVLQISKFYQSRKSQRTLTVTVKGSKIPLYGGGASLSSLNGAPTQPVPLILNFMVRSRAYVLGKLVKPKFYKRIECSVVMDPKKMNVPISLKNKCTYQ